MEPSSSSKIIQKASLGDFLGRIRKGGWRIVGPVRVTSGPISRQPGRETLLWKEVQDLDQLDLQATQTTLSPKEQFFPAVETILRYRFTGQKVEIERLESDSPRTVLFGMRPCDAHSLRTLDAVFGWDYHDKFYESRREATTIVSFSCTRPDDDCFCTSVGGGPGDTTGSDLLLTGISEVAYLVEVLSSKGEALIAAASELFTTAAGSEDKLSYLAPVNHEFDPAELSSRLPTLFVREHIWRDQSLRCLGCGTCAYVCPACTCFDMQDEANLSSGKRLRCWDSCAFGLFTVHASGHNPRKDQAARWRQRVMHKFAYLPERLNQLGCVGCGRCSRACPADINLKESLKQIMEIQG